MKTARDPHSLPMATCVGWGAGTLVTSTLLYATNTLLLRYLTDFVGIAAATAGTLLALSKVVDALVDPPIGILSDRTTSRMGRRRPWLLAGTIASAIIVVAIFSIPVGGGALTIAYVAVLLIGYAIAFSIFNIPYLTMPAEMTSDPRERSFLIQFRVYASSIAGIAATVGAPWLLQAAGRTHAAHSLVGLALAPIIVIGGLASFFATRDAPRTHTTGVAPLGLQDQVLMLIRNKPVLALLGSDLTRLIGLTSQSVVAAFFTTYYLRASDYVLGGLMFASIAGTLASQPFWVAVNRRLSKRATYGVAAIGFAVASLTWLLATPSEPSVLILLRSFVIGIFAGGLFLLGNSMLPDAVEHDYRLSGYRREGNLVASFTFCEQVAHAAAIAGVGWLLGAVGFINATQGAAAVQNPAVVESIRYTYAVAPAVFGLLSCVWLYWFVIDEPDESDGPDEPDDAAMEDALSPTLGGIG